MGIKSSAAIDVEGPSISLVTQGDSNRFLGLRAERKVTLFLF